MTILRIGATQKYSDGWERAFRAKGKSASAGGTAIAKAKSTKTSTAKSSTAKSSTASKPVKASSGGAKKKSPAKKRAR